MWLIKAPTMNECEEARGLRSFAFQKDSNYSKNLLERSVTTRALIKNLHCFWQWTVKHRLPSAPPLSVWSPNKVYASDGNRYFGFWRAFRDRKHNYRPTEARPLSSTDGLNSGLRENPNCHFQTENIQIFWKFSIIRISISFWIFIEDFAYYFTTNRTFLVG